MAGPDSFDEVYPHNYYNNRHLTDNVDYPPQRKILLMKSFFYVETTHRKKLLIVCGISNTCRSMWKIYIITMISLVECSIWRVQAM